MLRPGPDSSEGEHLLSKILCEGLEFDSGGGQEFFASMCDIDFSNKSLFQCHMSKTGCCHRKFPLS